ncbi:hypothetical protein PV350_45425 [Streptomyces sp. PA03-6a]|nr:hypothetical protein [Streptomyces sp. PA03-6a]
MPAVLELAPLDLARAGWPGRMAAGSSLIAVFSSTLSTTEWGGRRR